METANEIILKLPSQLEDYPEFFNGRRVYYYCPTHRIWRIVSNSPPFCMYCKEEIERAIRTTLRERSEEEEKIKLHKTFKPMPQLKF